MYRAEPLNGIGIPLNGSACLLFALHGDSCCLSAPTTPETVSPAALDAASVSTSPVLSGAIVIANAVSIRISVGAPAASVVADTVSVRICEWRPLPGPAASAVATHMDSTITVDRTVKSVFFMIFLRHV